MYINIFPSKINDGDVNEILHQLEEFYGKSLDIDKNLVSYLCEIGLLTKRVEDEVPIYGMNSNFNKKKYRDDCHVKFRYLVSGKAQVPDESPFSPNMYRVKSFSCTVLWTKFESEDLLNAIRNKLGLSMDAEIQITCISEVGFPKLK